MATHQFTILKNGIDTRLEIIQDNETGFYNITKTAKMIADLSKNEGNSENNEPVGFPAGSNKIKKEANNEENTENNEPGGIRPGSNKMQKEANNEGNSENNEVCRKLHASNKMQKPSKWFNSDTTKTLIDEVIKQTRLDNVNYELKKGVNSRFAGTYVHKLLFDHFLAWLDPRYAIKISIILDSIHQDANRKLLQEKNDAITRLEKAIQKQSFDSKAQMDEQSKKIDKLLNYSNAITRQNVDLLERTDHLQITADMTQEELDKSLIFQKEILNHLVDKSYKSTMNPANPNQITNFAVLMPNKKNGRTILVRGQVKHVNRMINKYSETHKLIIDSTYNANAINLVINAKQAYEDYRDNYIDRYNAPIIQYNDNLRAEINEYNKQSAIQNKIKGATFRGRRSYYDERMPLLTTDDIPIKFGTTFITYKKNKHIRYKEVIQCIKDVNELTQKSPAASDDGN